MVNIINPYIAGNPVTGQEMFFGRQDIFQFITQTLVGQYRDNVIVLYGQRRTGKTSVLYQMHSHLEPHYLCIFMDMHGFALEGLRGLLWEFANHIRRVLRRDYQIKLPPLNRAEFMLDPRSSFEHEFLHSVQSAIGDRHLLLMLDEAIYLQEQVLAGRLEREVFEYMRYLMQHYEWLNFLFSLGSGLEEMEKEYAFLFNLGLYKKISFLDRKAASDLIIQPVKDYYQVDSAAVDRIYHVTSGHPYYTQLICHCLFNLWQQEHMSHIQVQDVDNVLDEALERGSAVLKYSWEELTSGEKAVLVGIATAMNKSKSAVNMKDVTRVWRRYNIYLLEGKQAQAIRSLMARDVIVGQEKFVFTVDLQRLWVQKYRRIEWAKEEITDLPAQKYESKPLLWPTNSLLTRPLSIATEWVKEDLTHLLLQKRKPIPLLGPINSLLTGLIITMVVLLIVSSARLLYVNYYLPNQPANVPTTAQTISSKSATALSDTIAALDPPYPPNGAQLVLDDLLRDNSQGYNWDENSGGCQFRGDGYHIVPAAQANKFWCTANATSFSNFVYEARMTILKGDSGGLIFRADASNSNFYEFDINRSGSSHFSVHTSSGVSATEETGQIPSFHQGTNQSNLIAVEAKDNQITFFVNYHYIGDVTYYNFSQGQIGFEAPHNKNTNEVVFTDTKVWKL